MKRTKIITVANRKGGAGKSTLAAHLSLEALRRGLKTLLIDLDPQQTLTQWWEKRTENDPILADIDANKIASLGEKIGEQFDICIIDTPGDISQNALEGIRVSDHVIVPCKPSPADLKAVGRTLGMFKEHNKEHTFVLTQCIKGSALSLEAMALLSEFGKVTKTLIYNRASYVKAMQGGESAAVIDKKAAEELSELWEELYERIYKNDVKEKQGENNVSEKAKVSFR